MNVELYCDSKPIFLSSDPNYKCLKLKLSQQLNKTDSLVFEIPHDHPNASVINQMSSYITLYMDSLLMFEGRVIQRDDDFEQNATYTCEGSLGYLLDSIQRPAEYHDTTVLEYFTDKITKHNAQVGENKQFTVGTVTVTNSTDNAYRIDNDYPDTLTNIQKKLVERLGGYLRVRMVNGTRYIDYVQDYGKKTDQVIKFGENMLDLTKFIDSTSLATRLIPLGANDETTGLPLTVASVNDGKDYIDDTTAQGLWGIITKTVTYSDVTLASNLLTKGQADLSNMIKNALTIKLKAVDMSQLGVNIQSIALGDSVRCVSAPHNLDDNFTVSIRTYDFLNPENSEINLETVLYGLTNSTVNTSERVNSVEIAQQETNSTITQRIIDQTKQLMGGSGGYFYFHTTDANVIDAIYCMDTPDIETCQNVWVWNKNGMGVSHTGKNGPFTSAWTQDGGFNASLITAGVINAIAITGSTITGGTITGNNISGGTVSGTEISGGTIKGTSIQGSSVSFGSSSRIKMYSGSRTIQNVSQTGCEMNGDGYFYLSAGRDANKVNGIILANGNFVLQTNGRFEINKYSTAGDLEINAWDVDIYLTGKHLYWNGVQKW